MFPDDDPAGPKGTFCSGGATFARPVTVSCALSAAIGCGGLEKELPVRAAACVCAGWAAASQPGGTGLVMVIVLGLRR
jgi:hypothetical protein